MLNLCFSERSEVDMHNVDNHSVEWVPDDYWEPSRKFEKSMLGDAEQQLQGTGTILKVKTSFS